jgi:recombination protein RecT
MSDLVSWVRGVEPECLQLASVHSAVSIPAEMNYAIQLLTANQYAAGIAVKNPVSVQNALRNASAIGISLNPANKHAYLVPRSGAICLDISYMGLMHLAQSTGSIEWGQAKLVYAADNYVNQGIDKAPLHEYPAFGQRGAIVGGYCTVKTSTGAYLTEEMSIDQINQVKSRSESAKKNSGPWVTDYEEMCRKTVVKRASKYWPKVDRLNQAIDYLNTDGGEGINTEQPVKDVTPISMESEAYLQDYYNGADDETKPKIMAWLKVDAICNMTERDAQAAIKAIKTRANK